MMSKGSKQRPLSVSKQKFDENFDRIFGKKDQTITVSVVGTKAQGTTLTAPSAVLTITPKEG